MTGYDYLTDLNNVARRQRQTKPLRDGQWQTQSSGSLEPTFTTMDSIMAAYEEARATDYCW